MFQARRLVVAGAAVLLAATSPAAVEAAPIAAAPAEAAALPVAPRKPEPPVSVTLITGDRVIVSAHGTAIERAPGRARIRFVNQVSGGHRHVIPVDALPLLRQGRLDQRLFDITALTEYGYTGDTEMPLLLAYPGSGGRGPARGKAAVGATARAGRDLPAVDMLPVRAPRAGRAALWHSLTSGRTLRPGVEKVYLDGKRRLDLDVSVPQIGAPAAWRQGLDGTGVTVAVLDSGIDATHPDFAGKIAASENFTDEPGLDDSRGHGTHVASIIAGTGARSGGRYRGVAPGAKLAIGKVCAGGWCSESSVLAGMQWAAQQAPVVSMSLGTPDWEGVDPLEQAVEDLTAQYGALFVIAAGNQGARGGESVDSPASADSALAVGAVDARDRLADFSSRGPRDGDGAIKPDITAPGVNIVAARAANGTIGLPAADGYVSLSGTSMATPHVAGAAAIVVQQHPGWTPRRLKTLLMGAADPIAGTDLFGQGAGRLDVARAVRQTVAADQGSLDFGFQQWPHADDTPITKTVTYHNGGTTPVALTLAVDGDPGTFALAATSLTVPAGGTASTTVTADTSGAGADGFVQARVVATAPGDVRVETPMAVHREVESYDVTMRHLGTDGAPSLDYYTSLIGLDVPGTRNLLAGQEQETVRLPKGSYGVFSFVSGVAAAVLVQPTLVVDGPAAITLDARRGRPITITAPRAGARQVRATVNAYWNTGGGTAGSSAESVTPGDLVIAQIGPDTAPAGFQSTINSVFARWDGDNGFLDSPYTYETSDTRRGRFFTGFRKRISPAKMATVKARYAREADGATTGVKYNWPVVGAVEGGTVGVPFTLPFERTEHLDTQGGVRWGTGFEQQTLTDPESGPESLTTSAGPQQQLKPGRSYRQDWNRAVFAPSEAGGFDAEIDRVIRAENVIEAGIPLFSDGAGHWMRQTTTDSARTALYSGATLIGETDSDHGEFPVPAARQDYRLEMSATRPAPIRLSTSVSGVWTFSSASGDTSLPLSTVRFSPKLDRDNAAAAGAFTVPVTVTPLAGSAAAGNRTLTAQFSADDGKTWQPATVLGAGNRRKLRVTNPAAGFVSLRVAATDTAGNTATVTVLRAYAIG